MSTQEKIIRNKVGLLKLSEMLGSVSEARKVMGYSREKFATGKTILISSLDKPTMSTGLAVSPDGRSILFVQNELAASSIMLVRNFR